MILSSIEKLAGDIGFDIGMSSDDTQANLLNGFSNALFDSMQERNRETQLCYIAGRLNRRAVKVIKALNEFIELKESDQDGGEE